MKMRFLAAIQLACVLGFGLSGCHDGFWGRDPVPTYPDEKVALGGRDTPGDLKQEDGGGDGNAPYPDIIEREFIPAHRPFAGTKCLAWRITWPTYPGDMDTDKIPGVFSAPAGALNSFYYLNNVSPQATYNTSFSLYHGDKVESTFGMWDELTYSVDGSNMETVFFALSDQPLSTIEEWVKERPSQFESYWPEGSNDMEMEYDEGDIIVFKLVNANRYGGIRIVSMTPRVIEVYVAVPND
jgi:hypothetical protein